MLNLNKIQLTNNDKKPVGNTVKPYYSSGLKSALSQDVFIQKNKFNAIPFKGLTRELSNHLYATKEQVMKVVDKYLSKNKGIAGSMPSSWVQNIPQAGKSKSIKEVYSGFSKAVGVLNCNGTKIEEASSILTSIFKKEGIIEKSDRANLEFINYGSFGTGYLLEVPVSGNLERYVLKISPEKRFNDQRGHGLHLETNRALFSAKNVGKKLDRTPFYFADFQTGYMLVKCVDGTLPQPKKVDLQRHCLSHNDDSDNTIYQHKIEYGGLFIMTPAARTKTSRWVYKQVFDAPVDKKEQVWQDLYNNKTLPNREEVELGLAATVKFLVNRDHYTDMLLENNPSKNVKLGLLDKSFFSNGYEHYDQMIKDADLEVRLKIIEAIPGYHVDRVSDCANSCLNYLKSIDITKQPDDPLVPTAKDLVAVLLDKIEPLDDEEKQGFYDQLLSISDDQINVLLAQNLHIICDPSLKQHNFEILVKNASVEVVNALIPKLSRIDTNLAKSYFKEFAQIKDDKTKALLVKASSIFSKKEQANWFVQLAKNSGPMTQLALIHSLKDLPEENRYSFIKENLPPLKELKMDALIRLVHNIYSFPKEEGYEIYDALTEDLSAVQPKLLDKLFTQIKYFHDDKPKQQQMFRKFATVKNNALRSKMLNYLELAPEDFKADFVRLCAKNLEGKDGFIVTEIIDKLELLSANEIEDLTREFYSFKEPLITETLIHQIEYLPKYAIGKSFDVFANDFKSLNKELQDHLVYLIYNSSACHSISESSKKYVKDNMDPVLKQKIEDEKAGIAVR